jgi:hypothetical protein
MIDGETVRKMLCVVQKNKVNLRYCASGWFYYKKMFPLYGSIKIQLVAVNYIEY